MLEKVRIKEITDSRFEEAEGVNVHDLIKLKSIHESNFDELLENWVLESLKNVPFVVVRRGYGKQKEESNYIAVGIRGKSRKERFGCYMLIDNCEKIITPEQIVEEEMWISLPNSRWSCVLGKLDEKLKKWKDRLKWGPTGSVGFELVTKKIVTREQSDLDIIIKPKKTFTVEEARKLLKELDEKLNGVNSVIDPVIQTGKGWIVLSEYAEGLGTYLIKTEEGEELVKDIW